MELYTEELKASVILDGERNGWGSLLDSADARVRMVVAEYGPEEFLIDLALDDDELVRLFVAYRGNRLANKILIEDEKVFIRLAVIKQNSK